jgi:O-succinylbenzoate synthase
VILHEVELFHVRLELTEPFVTSFGRVEARDLILIRAESDAGVGWGEAPTLREPVYTGETALSSLHVLADFMLPAVLGQPISSAEELLDRIAFVRGNNSARYAIESTVVHLLAAAQGRSTSQFLGGVRSEVDCGLSVGIRPDLDDLVAFVADGLQTGFRRIKLKIRPGWDLEPVRAVRAAFPDVMLSVDANGAYSRDHLDTLTGLDGFDLIMIEQPFGYEDLTTHAALQRRIGTRVCLDESLDSVSSLESAIELGACQAVNVKLSRVGGFVAAKEFHDVCRAADIPVWCGGVFESAIGQSDSLAIASLPGFVFPADIGPSARYFTRDLIDPWIEMEAGQMAVPTGPGIGFPVDEDFIRKTARGVWRVPGHTRENWTLT